ncbi:MAG: UDP-N-acetylmuramate dehydrogenase [Polyangiales bacterium]
MTRLAEPLSAWTTLGVGGPAERFHLAESEAELIARVREADEAGRALTVLGGGSNVVVADAGVAGDVVRVAHRGVSLATDEHAQLVLLTAAAGEPWDEVVARAVHEGLAGVECLSGIPGLVGATPVQNVGAYGQEVADTISSLRVWDRADRTVRSLGPAACDFRYRDSAFKRDASRRYVVLDVTYALRAGPPEAPRYGELSRAMAGRAPTLATLRETVLSLRRAKGMVLDPNDPDSRSAGSFFTNPVVPRELADEIEALVRQGDASVSMPRFAAPEGAVKLAAGWLIERAGVKKGERLGRAAVSRVHALALTNPEGDASAQEVLALAASVAERVRARFGVTLRPEVVLLGARHPLWA